MSKTVEDFPDPTLMIGAFKLSKSSLIKSNIILKCANAYEISHISPDDLKKLSSQTACLQISLISSIQQLYFLQLVLQSNLILLKLYQESLEIFKFLLFFHLRDEIKHMDEYLMLEYLRRLHPVEGLNMS